MEENRLAQEEEKVALTSIYTEDFLKEVERDGSDQIAYQVRFRVGAGAEAEAAGEAEEAVRSTTLILTIRLPPGYPSAKLPAYELKEAYGEPVWITDEHFKEINEGLEGLFLATSSAPAGDGEHGVVLFEWIEWLKGWLEASWQRHVVDNPHLNLWQGQGRQRERENISAPAAGDFQNVTTSGEPQERPEEDKEEEEEEFQSRAAGVIPQNPISIAVHHSKEPLVDRKSVFVGHVAAVSSVDDVQRVKEYLLSNPKIARATHNILAYRIVKARAPGKGKHGIEGEIVVSDCDDDGENAAGGRLLHLLEVCDCRNVVVVVSRWYGGILLGPQRFKDINNVARQLLQEHGYIK